jgi:Calcium/calmodulin dependent protein kinase II association domain
VSQTQRVLDAAAKIVDDFGHHRTADYFAGFTTDASFMFYTHSERLDSRAAYEALWAKWETEDGFKVHGCRSTNQLVQLIGNDAAVFSHLVSSDIEFAGEVSTVAERETIVFALKNGAWMAVHEHLSPETAA